MFALRKIVVGVLIGAATVAGGGVAMANPLPLESPAPASAAEPTAGGWCDLNPAIGLWCMIASLSG